MAYKTFPNMSCKRVKLGPQNRPISTRKILTTLLIWNDRCQVDKLNYFFFFLHSFKGTFQVQATSTMNQSEIRGLSIWTEPTLIFSVMSYAFYKREFSNKAAYRKLGSHITLIVPAPVSANPISNFQVSKNNFGGRVIKEIFFSRCFPLLFSRLIFYHC